MTKPTTLIDAFARWAHTTHQKESLSRTIHAAHRFVLDSEMSAFLVDLARAGFTDLRPSSIYRNAEWIRESARLPFPITWVEYDAHARHSSQQRQERLNKPAASLEEIAPLGGWLLLDHDNEATTFTRSEGLAGDGLSCIPVVGDLGGGVMMLPLSYRWKTTDQPLVMFKEGSSITMSDTQQRTASWLALGLPHYSSAHLAIAGKASLGDEQSLHIAQEWQGELRYVWSFLATLNEMPVVLEPRRGRGGYMGRRQYRKYLDHTIVHLKLPTRRSMANLANMLVKIARRKAHQVRGHWRRDWRHPGERIWVRDHQRGDASLGFVKHDYSVEKKE